MKKKRFLWAFIALLIVSSLILGACGQATEEPTEAPAPTATEDMSAGTYYERAMAGEFDGTVVTMTGPFTDEDAVKFNNSVAAFEEATGIDVQYEGSKEFEASISVRVEGGDAPDIADFPQPGLLKTFVAQGEVVDVSTFLPESSFENYNQSWWDMAEMEGPDGTITAGVWHRFNAKSQVWYPQEEFEAAGYEIPETWDEMMALSDQIVADGDKPWCVGIESGAATGWPATDWLEEIMLRTTSLENYDKWTTGELPFSSPEVKNALSILDEVWSAEYVYGGREGIVTTFFGDAPTPMFEDPPKCWLHKQGNFITSFFPEGVEAGTDYGFFYLPPIDEEYGKPYLVAGDIMAMFNDRPEVRAVMEYFTHGEAVKEWLAAGGALSPHEDAQLDWYGDDIERGIAALVNESTSVRFDGSDLMPGEVGAGSFWTGMTDFFSGTADMDTVLSEIDASWPDSGEEMGEEEALKVGLVTDVGEVDDKSFNQSAWEGVEMAADEFGAEIDYIETSDAKDYMANIDLFAQNDFDIIVTVGFALGEATLEAAEKYPDVYFIGVDQFQGAAVGNVAGLIFEEDKSGFMAGALAGLLTETDTVAAVLGTDLVPPVVAFKEGYESGVAYVNENANVISTYHPGGMDVAFTDPEWGATTARQALDNGADVVFGAGGKTGNGALIEVAGYEDAFCIGVDSDQWFTVPEAHPCLVSSAMKLITPGVFDLIELYQAGDAPSGNYVGEFGLAPFHDFEDDIPQDIKDQLAEIREMLLNDELDTGYPPAE